MLVTGDTNENDLHWAIDFKQRLAYIELHTG